MKVKVIKTVTMETEIEVNEDLGKKINHHFNGISEVTLGDMYDSNEIMESIDAMTSGKEFEVINETFEFEVI